MVAAALGDLLLTPSRRALEVERELPERIGLSRDFPRRLRLAHPRAAGRRVRVHEEFPAAFEVRERSVGGAAAAPAAGDPTGGADAGRCDGTGRIELVRLYRSPRRGVFAFGGVRVRVRGPLGLVEREVRLAGPQEVAVAPALAHLKQTLRLAASERWRDLGVRRLRARGGETEFESLREYVPGDEVRRVDWKAFARRGKPMVRQYEVERGQELILLVDRGRRMRAAGSAEGERGWTKLDWALDAALELAAVALAKGDRVGAAVFDRRLASYVPPAKRGRQLSLLSQAFFPELPTDADSDLARALRELAARHRRRATVIVLSEVADPHSVAHQRRALAAAARRHRVVFAALDDPGVRAAAAGEGASTAERAAALDLVEDRRRALRALAGTGARILDALPAEAAGPLLAAWLEERRGAARARRGG
ncbi:MAG: DUF58 domain-containing protein [Planctomycetota bacterium]